ncbi:unnamed protein product, partial [Rotaria sp. Silwood2]
MKIEQSASTSKLNMGATNPVYLHEDCKFS